MKKALPTYPRTVYYLTQSHSVRKVTLTTPYSTNYDSGGYTERRVFYSNRVIHETPAAAIKEGRRGIERRLKGIARSQDQLSKDIDALNKAEAKIKLGPAKRPAKPRVESAQGETGGAHG